MLQRSAFRASIRWDMMRHDETNLLVQFTPASHTASIVFLMLCCWCKWRGQCKAWYAFEMPHEGGFWQLSTATILQQWEYLNATFVNVRPKFLMQCGLDEVAHQRMGFSRWVAVQLSKGNILTYITSDGKVPLSVGVGFRRYCLWKKSCTSWDRSKHDKRL